MAHFEVYILNYNGSRFLSPCLESLENLELGEHSVAVNVVDNGSSDDSEKLVKTNFPRVNYIALGSNLGYSTGNNRGVWRRREALHAEGRKADFHVFLNNDTTVEKSWLAEAAEVLLKDPQRGVVGVKSLFMDSFLPVVFKASAAVTPNRSRNDDRELAFGLVDDGVSSHNFYLEPRSKYFNFYGPEIAVRWGKSNARFLAALRDPTEDSIVTVAVCHHALAVEDQKLEIMIGDRVYPVQLKPGGRISRTLDVPVSSYRRAIQNAGSYVTPDLAGGDIGFGEIDVGQFDSDREVDAICGVSMFVRDDLFVKLGGFDERYFAYYEDTDLSLRARQLGYKCWYASKAVINHLHCGSGGEYSEYFNQNVAWSRFLFVSKFAGRDTWSKLKKEYRQLVRTQMEGYAIDYSFERRPHLRTWGRYLKYYPSFVRTRFRTNFQPTLTSTVHPTRS